MTELEETKSEPPGDTEEQICLQEPPSPTCGANCAGKGCVILTAAAADWNCFWYTMLFILLD